MGTEDRITAQELETFESANDDVMGGISSGSISGCGEKACFSGTVRTDNNGGFASIKKMYNNLDLSKYSNIKIKAQENSASDKSGCAIYTIGIMDNADISFANPMRLMCNNVTLRQIFRSVIIWIRRSLAFQILTVPSEGGEKFLLSLLGS